MLRDDSPHRPSPGCGGLLGALLVAPVLWWLDAGPWAWTLGLLGAFGGFFVLTRRGGHGFWVRLCDRLRWLYPF